MTIEDSVANRPQQYLTVLADLHAAVRCALFAMIPICALVFAPWNAPGAWIRVGLLAIWGALAGAVLSQGHRVRGAKKAALIADPDAMAVPLRAVVIDRSDRGGVYEEDVLMSVAGDGALTWSQLDSSRTHQIGPDRIASVRVQQPEHSWRYPYIVVASKDGEELQLHLMRSRQPMWRLGASQSEIEETADAIRDRIEAAKR